MPGYLYEPSCTNHINSGAALRDKLLGALIGVARSTYGNEYNLTNETAAVIVDGLVAALSADIEDNAVQNLLERTANEKHRLVPGCATCAYPCGRTSDCDMPLVWRADKGICALKVRILTALYGIAVQTHSAAVPGAISEFLYKGLFAVGEDWDPEYLMPIVTEAETLKNLCESE